MITGIKISIESVNFGICNSIMAGREMNITNLFNIAAASTGKIRNWLKTYPMEMAKTIKIKFSINNDTSLSLTFFCIFLPPLKKEGK
jgi:hypothetical protein